MEIKLIKNTFYNESMVKESLINFIAKAQKLSMGEQCKAAEENFAQLVERAYSVLFNSGSSANLALLQAYLNLGYLQKGDKVGFSSLTWSTNVMPLLQLGLHPFPIDINLDTLNVNSKKLLEAIKQYELKAFFATNILGLCDDLEKIQEVCKEQNVLFFEDNCESLGSRYKGKLLGNFGDAATYSFYVGHHLSTIEGGAVTTDNEELYTMLLLVRAHGWDRSLPLLQQQNLRTRYQIASDFYDRYTFYDLGYNLRPTEITGFLLNENLKFAQEIFHIREQNFSEIYNSIYESLGEELYKLKVDHLDKNSNFAIPLVFKTKEVFKEVLKQLEEVKFEIRPLVAGNIFNQPFYKKYSKTIPDMKEFPNISIIHEQGLYFGNNPDLTREEIEFIKSVFKSITL